jgi:hypothetical protein
LLATLSSAGVEPKHKIKGGQNIVIYVVSYKNTKNKLKGGWKKNFLAGTSLPYLHSCSSESSIDNMIDLIYMNQVM